MFSDSVSKLVIDKTILVESGKFFRYENSENLCGFYNIACAEMENLFHFLVYMSSETLSVSCSLDL